MTIAAAFRVAIRAHSDHGDFKATPHNYRLTPLLRIYLPLFRQPSQITSAEESLLPSQLVLSDEKSGGATAQQALCGVALNV